MVEILEDRLAPATLHWIGASGTGGNLWSVAANWKEDSVPVNGSSLVFDITTAGFLSASNGFNPDNDITGLTSLDLTINDTSGSTNFDLTGNAIGLSSTGISSDASSGNATVAMPLTIASATTFSSTKDTLIVSGAVSGAGGIDFSGGSTMVLSGDNTFTGAVNVNAGTLDVEANNALGTGASATTVAASAILNINGVDYTTNQPVTLDAGATLGSAGD